MYRPGCLEHYVRNQLRDDPAFVPEGEAASFFLCKELIPGYLQGITGEYTTPQGYFVDEAEVEAFDKEFPAKEKLKLPGQLFWELAGGGRIDEVKNRKILHSSRTP